MKDILANSISNIDDDLIEMTAQRLLKAKTRSTVLKITKLAGLAAAAAALCLVLPFGIRQYSGWIAEKGQSSEAVSQQATSEQTTSEQTTSEQASSPNLSDYEDEATRVEVIPTNSGGHSQTVYLPTSMPVTLPDTRYDYKPYTTDNETKEYIEKTIISYIGMGAVWGGYYELIWQGERLSMTDGGKAAINGRTVFDGERVRTCYTTYEEILFLCSREEALDETVMLYSLEEHAMYTLKNAPSGLGRALLFENGEPFIYEYLVIQDGGYRLIQYTGKYKLTEDCFVEAPWEFPTLEEVSGMNDGEAASALTEKEYKELEESWGKPREKMLSDGKVTKAVWDFGKKHVSLEFDLWGQYIIDIRIIDDEMNISPMSEENGVEYIIYDRDSPMLGIPPCTENIFSLFEYADRFAVIYGYMGEDETLVIPETIEGAPVLGIEGWWSVADGFVGHGHSAGGLHRLSDKVKNIEVPECVKYIGENAFGNSTLESSLKENNDLVILGGGVLYKIGSANGDITVPDEVKRINADAFKNSGVTSVTVDCEECPIFGGCEKLKSVTLGGSLKNIPADAFYNCPALEEIKISGDCTEYKTIDGVVYTGDGKALVKYPPRLKNSRYAVPEGTEEIKAGAFCGCENLTIDLPDSIKLTAPPINGTGYTPASFDNVRKVTVNYKGKSYAFGFDDDQHGEHTDEELQKELYANVTEEN